ncbi:crotonase/enoyl-CoA hydratase family protein [Enemella sp. A6]|uniref:crotonase/enoyl-CoA hydratase family protein n=1 Tax=Enemella sp. A6 TaxID=3440152 RepID=UPI003EB9B6D9
MTPGASPNPAETPDCLIEQHGHVLQITLNRPEARNALTGEMMQLLGEAWDRMDNDPEIRVAVLTGAEGTFCAGADLKAMSATPAGDRIHGEDGGGGMDLTRMPGLLKGRRPSKPIIAAVEGYAIAGGTEILLGTDIRVAGAGARFGLSEPKWGLFPMGGSSVRLPRQIPYTAAADILLTGRHIDAEQALAWGLIGEVVPDGQALTRAMELAEMVCANSPIAVQAILKSMRDTEGLHELEAFEVETKIGVEVFRSDDSREGPRAFAEKRKPNFTGR